MLPFREICTEIRGTLFCYHIMLATARKSATFSYLEWSFPVF